MPLAGETTDCQDHGNHQDEPDHHGRGLLTAERGVAGGSHGVDSRTENAAAQERVAESECHSFGGLPGPTVDRASGLRISLNMEVDEANIRQAVRYSQ